MGQFMRYVEAVAVTLLACANARAEAPRVSTGNSGRPGAVEALRDRFGQSSQGAVVGRLAILLVSGNREERVSVLHPFHPGDTVRFEVSSSLPARIDILSRTSLGGMDRLWPPDDEEQIRLATAQPRIAVDAPPRPAQIRLSDDRAHNYFCAAISASKSQSGEQAKDGKPHIVDILVRGQDVEGRAQRGLQTKPDEKSPEIYFSDGGQDDGTAAAACFELRVKTGAAR